MARQRSPVARLIDNARRRIRHLNEKLKDDNIDNFDRVGYERNKKNIEKFIKKVKEEAAKGTLDVNEKTYELKENSNLSNNDKKIEDNTRKMIFAEPDKYTELMGENSVLSDIFSDFAKLGELYIGKYATHEANTNANDLLQKIDDTMKKLDSEHKLSDLERTVLSKMTQEIELRMQERGRGFGMLHPLK